MKLTAISCVTLGSMLLIGSGLASAAFALYVRLTGFVR